MAVRKSAPAVTTKQDSELRGVHRLAGAVLVQAIDDIRCGSGRKKIDALRWVEDPSQDQFSFVFCCRVLSRNPEEVRRFLARQEVPSWFFTASMPDLAGLKPGAA